MVGILIIYSQIYSTACCTCNKNCMAEYTRTTQHGIANFWISRIKMTIGINRWDLYKRKHFAICNGKIEEREFQLGMSLRDHKIGFVMVCYYVGLPIADEIQHWNIMARKLNKYLNTAQKSSCWGSHKENRLHTLSCNWSIAWRRG